ncbi:hypothetical protein F5883DRAFT_529862 [Diaporthe sp. PMI_573]|nr:hypothetical protein F5883DRAFT_529862 [Diaporthaceae sp. PMI_573]
MMNRSIKAATPATSLGRNHGLQVEQRDYLIASKQPGLDGDSADSADEEFPAFVSDEFIRLAHLWCESMCLLSTTASLFPPAIFTYREAVHRPQKAKKLKLQRSRPRRSPRIKIKVRNGKIRAPKGVRRSARIAARMKSRDVYSVI